MSLYQLLYAISQGRPINLDSLHKALPSSIKPSDLFGENEMVAKNRYIVSVIDQQGFEDLLMQSKAPTSRKQAASHTLKSSHYIACDSAYMLCFPISSVLPKDVSINKASQSGAVPSMQSGETLTPRNLMSIASVRSHALPLLFTPAKHAILIENQDCFFDWQTLMRHFASTVNVGECDIYFAGGKRILNSAFAPFLKQYENLYCAFDYDLDGLKMVRSLMIKNYANTMVLLPDRLSNLHRLFTFKPASTSRFIESLEICKQMNLDSLSDAIISTQNFMEQEALLSLSEPS